MNSDLQRVLDACEEAEPDYFAFRERIKNEVRDKLLRIMVRSDWVQDFVYEWEGRVVFAGPRAEEFAAEIAQYNSLDVIPNQKCSFAAYCFRKLWRGAP